MGVLQLAVTGILIGVPLGYALQRSELCFNRAYREVQLFRQGAMIRMIVLAILVQMIGLAILIQFNIGGVQTNIVPFWWLGAIIGGFIFGLSMVYAQGCSSTVWYRTGTGNLGALVTLIGFATGEWLLRYGFLRGVLDGIQSYEVKLPSGEPATLPNALGLNSWMVIIPLALALIWWLSRGRIAAWKGAWDWRKGGLILGAIGVLTWIVSQPSGWAYGAGVVGASAEFVEIFRSGPGVLNWGSYLVLAMPVGAFIAGRRMGVLRWRIPGGRDGLRFLAAGLAMGMSATVAGGCNIGHGFSGVPTLALSSLTATIFTFLGAWLGNYLWFVRGTKVPLSAIEVKS
jgi:uncharacterized membrane protein YedE/YeeE